MATKTTHVCIISRKSIHDILVKMLGREGRTDKRTKMDQYKKLTTGEPVLGNKYHYIIHTVIKFISYQVEM